MNRNSEVWFRKPLCRVVLALSLVAPDFVLAQESEDQDTGKYDTLAIEEITVTGTKRDVAQQDLAVAVSTVTAQQIERTFQTDVRALGQIVPNLTLTNNNGFNAVAGGIRGTGFISILVTKDPSTGVLVDDFALQSRGDPVYRDVRY